MTSQNSRSRRFTRREAIGLLGSGVGLGLTGALRPETVAAAQATFRSVQKIDVPRNAIIRTILKDMAPDVLANGATLIHEHLGGDVDLMVQELRWAAADGLGCLVNATTSRRTDQQVEAVRQIAMRSSVHIVLAGGYLEDLGFAPYPPHIAKMNEEQLVEEFVTDAAKQRWGAFGEIGTSLQMQPDERKVLRAIGKAHVRTGVPIFTHVPHEGCPSCALEQLDVFESVGVSPRSVCIGHLATIQTGQDPEMKTHQTIAKRGAFVDFGPVGHEMARSHIPEAEKARRFKMLVDAGIEDQLLLTSDMGNSAHYQTNWGHGYSSVMMQFVPKLRKAGVKEATIRKVLVDNPRRLLAFVPKSSEASSAR
jgi:phosphotriesterase-related protein